MEPLTLKPRQPAEDNMECWDDDDDLQGIDELQFRNVSSTTVGSTQASHFRDSTSSRMSTRSDRESTGGGDEDWQVLLPTMDEKSTTEAINAAKTAGIPIPNNVPSSALLGGTIKRLGGRRLKKVLGGDDWGEDIEMPKAQEGGLKLKKNDAKDFPDALRQFSAEFPSSPSLSKLQSSMTFKERMASATKIKTGNSTLDKFRDGDDDDDYLFGDVPTIKVAKNRLPQKPINFIPSPARMNKEAENIEDDLELPTDGQPLTLSARKEVPKTPVSQLTDDLDMEWAEGSLGTRYGGTRRDARSNPSSSISAFSPSASSYLTGESEDEGLDGLVLPDGPFKFDEALKKRLDKISPDPADLVSHKQPVDAVKKAVPAKDDFFSGIEIGDGDVFNSGKLTLNRNVKHKVARQISPARRAAMTLTFTNKLEPGVSKIPKPLPQSRSRSTLEPVSESGGPIPHYRRPGSRMGGHSAHSSISAIPTPATPSSSHIAAPSTPVRRGLNTKSSRDTLRSEPTTIPAQLLKSKRSAPVMRSQPSPARTQTSYQRPQSRGGDYSGRQGLPSRPKTPVDRSGAESSLANSRRPPVPFLPAGTSQAQSHHISIKSSRHFNRPTSSDSNDNCPVNRPISRLSNVHQRPITPTGRRDHAPESLIREAASKRTLTKPTRRRAFGDGNELDAFDDLPTSASTESKFIKQPISRGAPKSVQMRSKLGLQSHNVSSTSCNEPPPPATPLTPLSPLRHGHVPSFARDTNASRLAREQRTGSVSAILHTTPSLPTVRESGPLTSISTNWKAHTNPVANTKTLASPSVHHLKKRTKGPPQKPRLIKPLGEGVNTAKTLKGMSWNPILFRWEGNEHALVPFEVLIPQPTALGSPKSPGGGKAAPALIANVGATKGVQMSGGMVFDPQRMCWLKMAPQHGELRYGSGPNPMSPDTIDDDDDPFAGLDDLDDGTKAKSTAGQGNDIGLNGTAAAKGSPNEWLVGEEFDVGPEFGRGEGLSSHGVTIEHLYENLSREE
ncbi:MAG: hypothetical protein ASARMPRED_000196 [Alectoria sarmentosa]|nr:MAG: hypothetical protein ASARMPRED_000196 [Alectoria sarmentosa]